MMDCHEDLEMEKANFASWNSLQILENAYFWEWEASSCWFSISTPPLFVSRAHMNGVAESVWIKNILVKQNICNLCHDMD